ncbi:hypothetical protein C8R43DRAFT_1170149, partial [Mycena crocata]
TNWLRSVYTLAGLQPPSCLPSLSPVLINSTINSTVCISFVSRDVSGELIPADSMLSQSHTARKWTGAAVSVFKPDLAAVPAFSNQSSGKARNVRALWHESLGKDLDANLAGPVRPTAGSYSHGVSREFLKSHTSAPPRLLRHRVFRSGTPNFRGPYDAPTEDTPIFNPAEHRRLSAHFEYQSINTSRPTLHINAVQESTHPTTSISISTFPLLSRLLSTRSKTPPAMRYSKTPSALGAISALTQRLKQRITNPRQAGKRHPLSTVNGAMGFPGLNKEFNTSDTRCQPNGYPISVIFVQLPHGHVRAAAQLAHCIWMYRLSGCNRTQHALGRTQGVLSDIIETFEQSDLPE